MIGSSGDIGILEIELVKGKRIGDEGNFIVADLAGEISVTAKQGDLPGFVAVGDRVGAAHVEEAVLLHQVDDDVDGFAC